MIRQKNVLAKINCISAGMHCQQWSRWTVRGESRQTKLITETRISTVREQEGGRRRGVRGILRKRGMNEWVKTYWSSWVQPLSPAVSPDRGLLHCLAAQAPLGTNPVFCPNYQLRFAEEGQRGEKISPSTPLCLNPSLARREADGASRMALDCTCTGGFPALPPFSSHTHTHNPQTITLFFFSPLSVGFNQVAFRFTKTPEAVTCSKCWDEKKLQNTTKKRFQAWEITSEIKCLTWKNDMKFMTLSLIQARNLVFDDVELSSLTIVSRWTWRDWKQYAICKFWCIL